MASLETGTRPVKRRRRILWADKDDTEEIEDSNDYREAGSPQTLQQGTFPSTSLLPAPYTYEKLYSSYGEEWKERSKSIPLHVEILDLASFPMTMPHTGNPYFALLACTSLGEVLIWSMSKEDDNMPSSAITNVVSDQGDIQSLLSRIPSIRCQVSNKPLKSLQVQVINSESMILVGGEGALWSISSLDKMDGSTLSVQRWSTPKDLNVKQLLVHEDRVYILEENGTIHIFSSRDRTLIRTLDLKKSFATCMATTTISGEDSKPLTALLIGTADSQLLVWNLQDENLETIQLKSSTSTSSSKLPFDDMSVTAISSSRLGQWWTLAGMAKKPSKSSSLSSSSSSHGNGVIITLHALTRTVVSFQETREVISKIVRCTAELSSSPELYTVGNEGVVSVWESPYLLQRTRRIWISAPSGKCITTITPSLNGSEHQKTNFILAVAGVGPTIDLIQDHCRIQTVNVQP